MRDSHSSSENTGMTDTTLPADDARIPLDVKIAGAVVLLILLVGFVVVASHHDSQRAQAGPASPASAPLITAAAPAPMPQLTAALAPLPTPQLTNSATAVPVASVAPMLQQPVVTPPLGLSGQGKLARGKRRLRRDQFANDVAQPGTGYMCPIALAHDVRPGCNTFSRTEVTNR